MFITKRQLYNLIEELFKENKTIRERVCTVEENSKTLNAKLEKHLGENKEVVTEEKEQPKKPAKSKKKA